MTRNKSGVRILILWLKTGVLSRLSCRWMTGAAQQWGTKERKYRTGCTNSQLMTMITAATNPSPLPPAPCPPPPPHPPAPSPPCPPPPLLSLLSTPWGGQARPRVLMSQIIGFIGHNTHSWSETIRSECYVVIYIKPNHENIMYGVQMFSLSMVKVRCRCRSMFPT